MESKKGRIKKLAEYIKYQRVLKKISAYSIQEKYGIDRAMWSKIENGKLTSLPKPELIMKISKILDINYIVMYEIVGYIKREDILQYLYGAHRLRGISKGDHHIKP